MFPEPTELLLIGSLIKLILTQRFKSNTSTPRTNSQTYWARAISHLMNGIIFCVKRTLKDSGEERVTAKSKPMMNLVSRCSGRTLVVLHSIASESPGETRYESQLPLSSWTEQHQRTVRLVMGANSSNYSAWNIDDTVIFSREEIWWSDGSKNGDTRCDRTAHGQIHCWKL